MRGVTWYARAADVQRFIDRSRARGRIHEVNAALVKRFHDRYDSTRD
jgi:hypothetical protein